MPKSRLITLNGETDTLAGWAKSTGLSEQTIANRIHYGWSLQDALTLPLRARRADKPHTPRVRKGTSRHAAIDAKVFAALEDFLRQHHAASRRLVSTLDKLTRAKVQTSHLHTLMRDSIGEPDPSIFKTPGVVGNLPKTASRPVLSVPLDRG